MTRLPERLRWNSTRLPSGDQAGSKPPLPVRRLSPLPSVCTRYTLRLRTKVIWEAYGDQLGCAPPLPVMRRLPLPSAPIT